MSAKRGEGCLPGVSALGGGGVLPVGVCPEVSAQTPQQDGHCRDRYTSYWNASLFYETCFVDEIRSNKCASFLCFFTLKVISTGMLYPIQEQESEIEKAAEERDEEIVKRLTDAAQNHNVMDKNTSSQGDSDKEFVESLVCVV